MPKVIIADDEEFVRQFLKTIMRTLSFEVIDEAEKGDEVYSVMKKKYPDILLLDINMPNLTGLEFLKQHSHEFPKTCIIILTSATSFKTLEEASQTGANYFIRKDMPVNQMINAIKKAWLDFKEQSK